MANEKRPWVAHYDPWVNPDNEVPSETYATLLERGFTQFADRTAAHFLGSTFSFADIERHSARVAHYLASQGLGKGDVIGVCLPNSPQYLIVLAGAIRAGCTVTGISLLLTSEELAYQLQDSRAKAFITLDAIFEKRFVPVEGQLPGITHVICSNFGDYLPRLKRIAGTLLGKIPTGNVHDLPNKTVTTMKAIQTTLPPKAPSIDPAVDDTLFLQYTGGTTGFPKGAELTHRNIVAGVSNGMHWLNSSGQETVFCSGYPFFHIAGLSLGLAGLAFGNTQILIPDPRNTGHIIHEIGRYRPKYLFMVPSLFQLLLNAPGFSRLDFSCIKGAGSGAAPFAAETIRELESFIGENTIFEAYGLTETSGAITSNPVGGKKKIGSVGLPYPNARLRIVDIETGMHDVEAGEPGEIIFAGPQILKAYFNRPEESQRAIRELDGEKWFYTGDIGRMDDEGYLYIVDRAKDMINVGGFKVFSTEVEAKLLEHPGVEFCAFVGVDNPDRPGNELVKAVIELTSEYKEKDSEGVREEIVRYCKEHMSAYKVPKIVDFIDSMPLTAVGKIDKKSLR